MKKLMIALAAVAVAAVAQAASIDWSIGSNSWFLSDGSTKAAKGTAVYLINAASWSDIKTAIDGGATSFTTSDTGILAVGTTSNAKGAVSGTATSTSLTAGTSYDFAYLVFDTTDASDVKYFASVKSTAAAYDPTDATYSEAQSITFDGASYSNTGLSGGWQSAAAVPEPTSGLLMLLGMAGLALRRKRA